MAEKNKLKSLQFLYHHIFLPWCEKSVILCEKLGTLLAYRDFYRILTGKWDMGLHTTYLKENKLWVFFTWITPPFTLEVVQSPKLLYFKMSLDSDEIANNTLTLNYNFSVIVLRYFCINFHLGLWSGFSTRLCLSKFHHSKNLLCFLNPLLRMI